MLRHFIRPDPHNLEPQPAQQLAPVALRALDAHHREEHVHIHGGSAVGGARGRQDEVFEEDARVVLVHGGDGLGEDVGAALVGPVVGDVAEEVDACACGG